MAKTTDISKKTVFVLAFLVIIISLFSTWSLLSVNSPQVVRSSGETRGVVSLEIVPQSSTTASHVTGNVGLTILS